MSVTDSPPPSPRTARQRQYLALMGVRVWTRRVAHEAVAAAAITAAPPDHTTVTPMVVGPAAVPAPPSPAAVVAAPIDTAAQWEALIQTVATCTACPLHKTRTQGVFGVGDRAARWFIVGEAPGEEEDLQGEPFVGRAGQLLDKMIKALGLRREEVYIGNILKSRPPGNRTPAPMEVAACLPYLKQQIELVRPSIILAAGSVAAQNLLASTASIGSLRGRVHRYGPSRIPLVATYHPSYLLRSPSEKRKAWDDLRLAWRIFHRAPPDGKDL